MSSFTEVDQSSSIKRFELLIAPGAPCRTEAAIFCASFSSSLGRNDAIDEADFAGALGVDQFGSQEQFAEIAFAELPPQESHDESGDQAAPHFRDSRFWFARRR